MITHHLHLTALKKKTCTILNKETLEHGSRFKSIFSGVVWFPVEQVNVQLSFSNLDHNQETEWFNSFVVVKKPGGEFRIWLDQIDLNKYIVRPVCNLNNLNEVSFTLMNAKFFSVFNAAKGFIHLLLNKKSKLLTMMLTSPGVYVFNVLTMGLSNSNDSFESV